MYTFCLYFYKIPTKYQRTYFLFVLFLQNTNQIPNSIWPFWNKKTSYRNFLPLFYPYIQDWKDNWIFRFTTIDLDYWDFPRKITLLAKKLGIIFVCHGTGVMSMIWCQLTSTYRTDLCNSWIVQIYHDESKQLWMCTSRSYVQLNS